MTELNVEANGLRVSVGLEGANTEALWAVAQAAFNSAQEALLGPEANNATTSTCKRRRIIEPPPDAPGSKAARVRAIAQEILADGRVHERREIAKAVREKGLDPQQIGRALDGHFEKGENALGRPTYRDLAVPSGYETPGSVPDEKKPDWMRNHRPAEWKEPAGTGTWGPDGIKLDGKNGG